jgi:hypothetical protein
MDTRIVALAVVVLQCGHRCACEGVRRGLPAKADRAWRAHARDWSLEPEGTFAPLRI